MGPAAGLPAACPPSACATQKVTRAARGCASGTIFRPPRLGLRMSSGGRGQQRRGLGLPVAPSLSPSAPIASAGLKESPPPQYVLPPSPQPT